MKSKEKQQKLHKFDFELDSNNGTRVTQQPLHNNKEQVTVT